MKTNPQPGAAVSAPTALPWRYDIETAVIESADSLIASVHSSPEHAKAEVMDANAELICRAANNHAVLVDALERLMTMDETRFLSLPRKEAIAELGKARNQAAQAIASAKGLL